MLRQEHTGTNAGRLKRLRRRVQRNLLGVFSWGGNIWNLADVVWSDSTSKVRECQRSEDRRPLDTLIGCVLANQRGLWPGRKWRCSALCSVISCFHVSDYEHETFLPNRLDERQRSGQIKAAGRCVSPFKVSVQTVQNQTIFSLLSCLRNKGTINPLIKLLLQLRLGCLKALWFDFAAIFVFGRNTADNYSPVCLTLTDSLTRIHIKKTSTQWFFYCEGGLGVKISLLARSPS